MQRHCLLLCRGIQSSAAGLQAIIHNSSSKTDPAAKAVVYTILSDTSVPLNSAQIWEQAEKAGLKSKRHTKRLLQSMRKAGAVQTKPVGKGQNYVYALKTSKTEAASKTPVPAAT
ncbi:hypothetical protein ABBQ38_008390 [Trebouxia sp. C0009 RCD-2024]